MSYKEVVKRSHPYEGDTPQQSVSERLPCMTGHDDRVESPQEEPVRWLEPYTVVQDEPDTDD